MALVGHTVFGSLVSLLLQQVLQKVKLLAQGDDKFGGLQSLLSRLQEPIDYLVNHEDTAGGTLVQKWLEDLRKELAKAESLVTKWPTIKRWNLRGRHNALKRLLRITKNLESLDNSQTVILASNVRNFHRLDEGVGRLDEGVGRLGEEVKTCVECLTSEARNLTEVRREFAQATEDALAYVRRATFPENIGEIIRKAFRSSGPGATLEAGCGASQSAEAVMHFNAQETFPDEVFGGNDIPDSVIAEILDGDYRQHCIGLWAMGGAGKTFTAGQVYHDPRIQSYFDGTRHRIWVTVSKRSTYSIMEEIFVKLGGQHSHFPAADDTYGVRSALKGLLNLGKFLLVIDDAWDAAQLDFMDLILDAKDSERKVILVTTRHQKILDRKLAMKFEVKLLSEDDSWKLFSKNAFGGAQVPTELRDVSRSVAEECKGLPLALKVLGSTMAGETNRQQWEISLKKLMHASVLGKEHEEQLFGRLQLSVDNLRGRDSRLQDCFYYFAAYPEDEEIEAQELVKLWMAEGIVGQDPDSPVSSVEEAYELLGTLIALSMLEVVQQNYYGNLLTACKIHDVMRDLARYNLEHNFGEYFPTTEKIPACQRLCLYRSGLQLSTFPKDWTILQGGDGAASTALSVERLSLMSNNLDQVPEQFDAPHLRVLLLRGNQTLESLPDRFFQSFSKLRVLNLQSTGIKEIPEAVFNLISLVLLNLNECESLRQISASIERLQNLQQLRICSCTYLKSIPRGLKNLKSLKVLAATETFIWDGLEPSGEDKATLQDVACLKALESLSITSRSSSKVSEISELTSLKILELGFESSMWRKLPESFTKMVNLRSLRLTCCCSTLPALDQLQQLEEFYIRSNELESFPDFFFRGGAFPSLQSFHVDCRRLKGLVPQPGAMPQINSFIIQRPGMNMKELPASFQELSTLIYLEVSGSQSMETLSAFEQPNSFPNLKEINLKASRALRNLPAGMMKSAPNLRKIVLEGTTLSRSDIPEDLLEKKGLQIAF